MPGLYDEIDLSFAWNGDYLMGEDGDLRDTNADRIQALIQDIQTIVASDAGDWEVYPSRGATLSEFVGEPNTRETGLSLRDRIIAALTVYGVVARGDLEVKVVPIDIHSLLIVIKVLAVPTPYNSLRNQTVVVSLVFDYRERSIMPMDMLGDRVYFGNRRPIP